MVVKKNPDKLGIVILETYPQDALVTHSYSCVEWCIAPFILYPDICAPAEQNLNDTRMFT